MPHIEIDHLAGAAMDYVFPPSPHVAIPVTSGQLFPVRRIFCVARNYADHAREMGVDPVREEPNFFMKPSDSVVQNNAVLPYPPATRDLHHEVELVVALSGGGSNIAVDQASACIFGYAVGLDMTRRDMQAAAKAKGNPWDMSKGFDHAAPLSAITPATRSGNLTAGSIELKVNGVVRQSGDLADMIWNVPEIISRLSALVTLRAGDLVFTGTPAGVGPVIKGDHLEACVAGLDPLAITIG